MTLFFHFRLLYLFTPLLFLFPIWWLGFFSLYFWFNLGLE